VRACLLDALPRSGPMADPMAYAVVGGKVVSTLEGGYDLEALADSVGMHVEVLMERGA